MMLHSDGVPDAFPAEIIARYHVALDEYVQHKTSVNVSFCFGFTSTIVLVFFFWYIHTRRRDATVQSRRRITTARNGLRFARNTTHSTSVFPICLQLIRMHVCNNRHFVIHVRLLLLLHNKAATKKAWPLFTLAFALHDLAIITSEICAELSVLSPAQLHHP
jgi:hypothetical protein